ncbi:organic cation transporter protein-like [Argonauta hians]
MSSSYNNIDALLDSIGPYKRFSITQMTLLCFSSVLTVMNLTHFIFVSVHAEYRCDNLTWSQLDHYNVSDSPEKVIYGECTITVPGDSNSSPDDNQTLPCLNGYHYLTQKDRSIVSTWDLVCENNGLAELTQTLYVIGQLIDGICCPIFIEKYGRKSVHVISNILLLVINLVCAFNPYFWVFAVMRFFTGLVNDCAMVTCVTAVVELFPKNRRLLMSGIFSFIWSFMNIVPGVSAYLLSSYSWTVLAITNSFLAGFFIVQIIFQEESIRWLYAHGKVERTKKVLQRAARQNKLDFDTIWSNYGMEELEVKKIEQENHSQGSNTANDKATGSNTANDKATGSNTANDKATVSSATEKNPLSRDITSAENTESVWIKLVDIFKMPYLRNMTFIVVIIWIVDATSYNGLYLLSESLGGNLYINFGIMSLAEAFAALVYIFALTRFGHKASMAFSKMFGGVCLLGAALLKIFGEDNETNTVVSLAFNLAAMLGIGAGYGGNYIYTPELYPTSLRSVGLGLASSVSRLFVMGAPYLRILAAYHPWLPSLLLGSGCSSTAILLWLTLPETKGKILPQTIEELARMRLEEKERKAGAKRNSIKPI